MSFRCARTPEGQAEIQARRLDLSRPVRNLLLVITPDRPAMEWVAQIKGCTAEDLEQLVEAGLLTRTLPPVLKRSAAAADEDDLAEAGKRVRAMAYSPLYDLLNEHAKSRLGLIGGYRFVLEIERCNGVNELQDLALRYVEQLRDKQGRAAARQFIDRLAAA